MKGKEGEKRRIKPNGKGDCEERNNKVRSWEGTKKGVWSQSDERVAGYGKKKSSVG